MNFNIGSIVTGVENSPYAVTNKNCICMVVGDESFCKLNGLLNLSNNKMAVMVLWRKVSSLELGSIYPVQKNMFKLLEDYNLYEKINNPDNIGYLIDKAVLEENLIKCQIKYDEETNKYIPYELSKTDSIDGEFNTPITLTEEEKNKLIKEVKEYLLSFGYQAKDEGTTAVIDEWLRNKIKLINLFKQHPNYNGKYQIVMENNFTKQLDSLSLKVVKHWLNKLDTDKMYYKEINIGKFSYYEAIIYCKKLEKILCLFDDKKIYLINGNPKKYYAEQFKYFNNILLKYKTAIGIHISNNKAYDETLLSKKLYYNIALHLLDEEYCGYTLSDKALKFCNKYYKDKNIKKDMLMIDVLKILFNKAGIDTLPDYDEFIKNLEYVFTPGENSYYTILSVHPIDFLSIGHGDKWNSLEQIDKVCKLYDGGNTSYSGSTVSYMLDPSSFVYYTLNKDSDATKFETELKVHRNIFHYNDSRIIQNSMYPYELTVNNSDIFTKARHIVQAAMATCLNVENKWILKRGASDCFSAIDRLGDVERKYLSNENCNISILKSTIENTHEKIIVGNTNICFNCGKSYNNVSHIMCNSHKNARVKCITCGKEYITGNLRYVQGYKDGSQDGWYCKQHAFYCFGHNRTEPGTPFTKIPADYCEEYVTGK